MADRWADLTDLEDAFPAPPGAPALPESDEELREGSEADTVPDADALVPPTEGPVEADEEESTDLQLVLFQLAQLQAASRQTDDVLARFQLILDQALGSAEDSVRRVDNRVNRLESRVLPYDAQLFSLRAQIDIIARQMGVAVPPPAPPVQAQRRPRPQPEGSYPAQIPVYTQAPSVQPYREWQAPANRDVDGFQPVQRRGGGGRGRRGKGGVQAAAV